MFISRIILKACVTCILDIKIPFNRLRKRLQNLTSLSALLDKHFRTLFQIIRQPADNTSLGEFAFPNKRRTKSRKKRVAAL